MRLWRLSHFEDSAQAFSGEGSRRYPGRWNPPGVPVVYTSSSLSLAALELLVHLDTTHIRRQLYSYSVEVAPRHIEFPPLSALPADWQRVRYPKSSRMFGGKWAAKRRSLGLGVPSIVVPDELNVILNPVHPAFGRLNITVPLPFTLDPRLLAKLRTMKK